MPRSPNHSPDQIAEAAMRLFWAEGFHALSMDDLVKATGISRQAIYGRVGDKRALYLAGFGVYVRDVVTPAFAQVEAGGGCAAITAYFEAQIARAEAVGLPGPGCLMGNALTEMAPRNAEVRAAIAAHLDRLGRGFRAALSAERSGAGAERIAALADVLVTGSLGLWALSRLVTDAAPLRRAAAGLCAAVEREMDR